MECSLRPQRQRRAIQGEAPVPLYMCAQVPFRVSRSCDVGPTTAYTSARLSAGPTWLNPVATRVGLSPSAKVHVTRNSSPRSLCTMAFAHGAANGWGACAVALSHKTPVPEGIRPEEARPCHGWHAHSSQLWSCHKRLCCTREDLADTCCTCLEHWCATSQALHVQPLDASATGACRCDLCQAHKQGHWYVTHNVNQMQRHNK